VTVFRVLTKETAMSRYIALLGALIGAALWAYLAVTPPRAQPVTTAATAFSADRAFADVRTIASAPHVAGSAEDAQVRAYLQQRLQALGAQIQVQPVPLPDTSIRRLTRWSGTSAVGAVGQNLIGVLPGRDCSLAAVLLMAHHDTVWGSPGAADDAMGVASALEVARAIRARGAPLRDVILLFTDSEELGLDGSRVFFDQSPLAQHVGVVINLEARGGGGRANMFETGTDNGAMVRLYADRVARPAANSIAVLIYNYMPNSTDYTSAKKHGIAGFNIATLGRAELYHSPFATPEAIDPASLQDMGAQALDLAGAMAFMPILPPRSDNAAFSDILGRITIAYPAPSGWIPVLAAALLIGFVVWRERPALRLVTGSAVAVLAVLLHGALLLGVLNAVSEGWPENYYDRLASLPMLEVMALLGVTATMMLAALAYRREPRMLALVPALALLGPGLLLGTPLLMLAVLTLAAMLCAWFLPRAAPDRAALSIAATLLLTVAAVLLQILLPTAAPLLAWPLLLAALAMISRSVLPAIAGLAISAIAAAMGLGHLAAFAHFTFLAVGADKPGAMIAFLFAGAPLLWPLLPDRAALRIAILLLIAALGIALWVRFDPMAPSVPLYSQSEGGAKTRE
jgi:Zn-dependent M28 family amino/carboxypeptidase